MTVWRSSSQVPVLDVAPVFPQVDDDAVGPGQFRQGRGGHRVGFIDEAGLPQGGHMINVYFQSRHAVPPCNVSWIFTWAHMRVCPKRANT